MAWLSFCVKTPPMEPGTFALFVLALKTTPDKVLAELSHFGGKVLQTSLSKEDEAKLQEALNQGAESTIAL